MQNGKGDKWRKTNFKKYNSNFDRISWKKTDAKKTPKLLPNEQREVPLKSVQDTSQTRERSYRETNFL